MVMVNKKKKDILTDNDFIEWQLQRTEDAERYWDEYVERYPEREAEVRQATEDFRTTVRLNDYRLPQEDEYLISHHIWKMAGISRRLYIRRILWMAACIALMITVGSILPLLDRSEKNMENRQTAGADAIIGAQQPVSELQLISGDRVAQFQKDAEIELSDKGEAVVNKGEKVVPLAKEVINTLLVPYGKRAQIQLSDGSKLWLNSGSRLDFPASFTGDTREISVTGEVYLEVAKGKQFIVHAGGFDVVVHGTKFNISSYPGTASQYVVLVEGKVEVEVDRKGKAAEMLMPDEMLQITAGTAEKRSVDVSRYISWTRGILIFDHTPITAVLEEIGRYYNVSFDVPDNAPLKRKTCSGKLALDEDFDAVMRSLSVMSKITYARDGNAVELKVKE
ncbi:MAG: FecR domain-containing protein [Bacteroidales bacterium]|jgi:ferric-dicitrate binding protein FerR (iron transport regulator)|nr:FecR domain-containing protein [Bacteroidales bacterium]